jgi:alkanesulfonate monooxygenase SsuD/methylene tetrahydromethanopterin reductase-like flavin-dependent oxidoreductase (luciferase family)
VKIGLQIPDFTTPAGPARLGADLATVARTADDAGFEFLAVMDHFFQIGAIGPRAHCDAEGRDYDDITKTCYFIFDVGEKGEKAGEVVDQLGRFAEMGFQAAIGGVIGTWDVTPLEVMGSKVIPAVASL